MVTSNCLSYLRTSPASRNGSNWSCHLILTFGAFATRINQLCNGNYDNSQSTPYSSKVEVNERIFFRLT
jgi:hypothetical protein